MSQEHTTSKLMMMQPVLNTFQTSEQIVSNGKTTGCLGYIGDYTTQLYGDYDKSAPKNVFFVGLAEDAEGSFHLGPCALGKHTHHIYI